MAAKSTEKISQKDSIEDSESKGPEVDPVVYQMHPDFDRLTDEKQKAISDEILRLNQDPIDRALRRKHPDFDDLRGPVKEQLREEMRRTEQDLKERCHGWRTMPLWKRENLLSGIKPELSDSLSEEELLNRFPPKRGGRKGLNEDRQKINNYIYLHHECVAEIDSVLKGVRGKLSVKNPEISSLRDKLLEKVFRRMGYLHRDLATRWVRDYRKKLLLKSVTSKTKNSVGGKKSSKTSHKQATEKKQEK